MRRRGDGDDDSLPVMVPRSDEVLVPISASRVWRLREHLIKALQELRTAKHWEWLASPERPEPSGFEGRVARTACALCKGWCCKNGDDDAFLDDRTLARVRLARPEMDERAMLRLYLDLVPPVAYRDSCIFHGKRGCTLDRSLRADICNSYYCGGLGAYMKTSPAVPVKVICRRRQDADFTGADAAGDTQAGTRPLTPGLHGVEWQGWLCAKETGLVDDNDELPLDLVVPTAVLDLRWVQDRDVVRAE